MLGTFPRFVLSNKQAEMSQFLTYLCWQLLRNANGKRFQESRVLDLFCQICQGLNHVHLNNILHRDLKTANILLTSAGIIKLADFGLDRVMSSTCEMARTQIGTPYYLSPEVMPSLPSSSPPCSVFC
jgi:NIMA (never in mitosis gene a)-related kinase